MSTSVVALKIFGCFSSASFSSIAREKIPSIYHVKMPSPVVEKVCKLGHFSRRCQKWDAFKCTSLEISITQKECMTIVSLCHCRKGLMSVYKQHSVPIHQLAAIRACRTWFVGLISRYINCHPIEPVYSSHLDFTTMLNCDEVPRKGSHHICVCKSGWQCCHCRTLVFWAHSVQKDKTPWYISLNHQWFNIFLTKNKVEGVPWYRLNWFLV